MRTLREIIGGLLLAIITTLTVLGGILLAVSESGESLITPPTGAATATAASQPPTPPLVTLPSIAATLTPAAINPSAFTAIPTSGHVLTNTALQAFTEIPSQTPTFVPTTTSAASQPPSGTGVQLNAPTTEPPTPTPCSPPPTWVAYVVRPGDTLFELSRRFGASVQQLQLANCLAGADIKYGQRLYVPFVPTPIPSFTPTATETPIPTDTPVPEPLRITGVALVNVVLDSSRPNGAIAFVRVEFTGGVPPYTVYDEDIPQFNNPFQALSKCGDTLIHTVRVVSADGQSASQTYYFSPIACP